MQNTVRFMRFGNGADCAAVTMLVNEALSVLLSVCIFSLAKHFQSISLQSADFTDKAMTKNTMMDGSNI